MKGILNYLVNTARSFPVPITDIILTEKNFTEHIARASGCLIKHSGAIGWLAYDKKKGIYITGDRAEKIVNLYIGEMAKTLAASAMDIRESSRRESIVKFAIKILTARGTAHIISLLKNEIEIAALPEEFDADPNIVNCCGLVVSADASTREAVPADMFTKTTVCRPEPGTPEKFLAFIDWATCSDGELKEWIMTALSISLFGHVSDKLINFYGQGGNGKGTTCRVIYHILKDYAVSLPRNLVVKSNYGTGRFDKANLPGKRGAFCFDLKLEPDERLNLDDLKSICGNGDVISIEKKHLDSFDAVLHCKIFIASNEKIPISATGESERRRFHLVPFDGRIKEKDETLEDSFVPEYPRILNLLFEYASRYYANGRKMPSCKAIDLATGHFFDSQDLVGLFVQDRCTIADGYVTPKTELFMAYANYLEAEQGIKKPGETRIFSESLEKRGIFESVKKIEGKARRVFVGITLGEVTRLQKDPNFHITSSGKTNIETNMNSRLFCNPVTGEGENMKRYSSPEQKKLWEDPEAVLY
jgi:P4 family phage/plasmid primase-like protien